MYATRTYFFNFGSDRTRINYLDKLSDSSRSSDPTHTSTSDLWPFKKIWLIDEFVYFEFSLFETYAFDQVHQAYCVQQVDPEISHFYRRLGGLQCNALKKESFRKNLSFFKILFERYYGRGYKRREPNDALRTATITLISATECVYKLMYMTSLVGHGV